MDRDFRLHDLEQSNAYLVAQNNDLMCQISYCHSISKQPSMLDLGTRLDNDKLYTLKKTMVDLLPPRVIASVLKRHYFVSVAYIKNTVDPAHFERGYEKMWSDLAHEKVMAVDLNFIALVFVVLAIALRVAPNELILGNDSMTTQWPTSENVEGSCQLWFNAATQILAFFKTQSVLRLQVLSLQEHYCLIKGDIEMLDDLTASAVHEARILGLNKPKGVRRDLERLLWWDICSYDTRRALEANNDPFVICRSSQVPLVSIPPDKSIVLESMFPVHHAHISKIVNGVFMIEQGSTIAEKLKAAVEIDTALTDFYSKLPLSTATNKVGRFQRNLLHIILSIHRYRLYEAFLRYELPIALDVCSYIATTMLKAYKELKYHFILSQDPLFISQTPQLVQAGIVLSSCLLYHHKLSQNTQMEIRQDVAMLKADIKSMRSYSPLLCAEEGLTAMDQLEVATTAISPREGPSIMRLHSVMNLGGRYDLSTTPTEMLEESLKLLGNVVVSEEPHDNLRAAYGQLFSGYLSDD